MANKCKVFCIEDPHCGTQYYLKKLEDEINKWFEKNPDILVISAAPTSKTDYIIIYRDLKEVRKQKLKNLDVL